MPLIVFILVLVLWVVLCLVVSVAAIRMSAKLFRSPCPTWGRAAAFWLLESAISFLPVFFAMVRPGLWLLGVIAVLVAVPAVFGKLFQLGWWRSLAAWITATVGGLVVLFGGALLVRAFVFDSLHGATAAMTPTIDEQSRFIVDKTLRNPQRWDLVVFWSPQQLSSRFVKRVVGLPGENVEITGEHILINGAEVTLPPDLDTPEYRRGLSFPPLAPGSPLADHRMLRLGAGEYYVVGDNTSQSLDSRNWPYNYGPDVTPGAVPANRIEGLVRVIYWPWESRRLLR